jgi:hypothetical protein
MLITMLITVLIIALIVVWLFYSGPLFVRTQRRSDGVVERYPHNAGNWEYFGMAILVALLLVMID